MAKEKKGSSGLLLGIITVFIPLITAIVTLNLQYVADRDTSSDEHYRKLVSQLTSKNKNERHAAAVSIGTYLNKEDRYFLETIDILATRVSSEPNYNVRNSIIASLKKIKHEPEYKQVIDRLLTIVRNNFIQDYQMKNALKQAKWAYDTALEELRILEDQLDEDTSESLLIDLERKKRQLSVKESELVHYQQEYEELKFNIPMVSNMISIFLSESKGFQINGLDFFRTDMNYVVLTDLLLKNSKIKWSTFSTNTMTDSVLDSSFIERTYFSGSGLKNVKFTNSKIRTTLFTDSKLHNADFSGSTFDDVYFACAELQGTRFQNVTGLKPEHFFNARNFDQAIFDDVDFANKINEVTLDDFQSTVDNSALDSAYRGHLRKFTGTCSSDE